MKFPRDFTTPQSQSADSFTSPAPFRRVSGSGPSSAPRVSAAVRDRMRRSLLSVAALVLLAGVQQCTAFLAPAGLHSATASARLFDATASARRGRGVDATGLTMQQYGEKRIQVSAMTSATLVAFAQAGHGLQSGHRGTSSG
eukprot:3072570-Rhodomonas_salina.1